MFETMYTRKSVRKFMQDKLKWQLLDDILNYSAQLPMLIEGIGVEIKLVSNIEQKQGFTGPFAIKAPYYICISSEDKEGYLLNAGYLMQHINLYIQSKGLGACFLGAAKPGKELASTMKYKYIIALAFGHSTEILKRDSSKAKRLSEDKIAVYKENAPSEIKQLIDAARLAPSSFNSQPWRFVVYENKVHMFAKKQLNIFTSSYNMKMLNMGIMIANFLIAADELWINIKLRRIQSITNKKLKNNEYVITALIY